MCPACGNKSAGRPGLVFNQAARGVTSWNSCTECGSFFVDQPYNRQAEVAHSQEMPWGRPNTAKQLGASKKKMYRSVLRLLSRYSPPPALLLDVGCSYGGFLLEARHTGYSVKGIDILAGAVEYVRSLNIPAEVSDTIGAARIEGNGRCDILTCLDCNYYWPDQRSELEGAFRRLKPGGYLVMRVVDKSWFFRIGVAMQALSSKIGERILAASVNDHRFAMPVQSLLGLLHSCGFEIVYASPKGALYSDRTRWAVKLAFWLGTLIRNCSGVFLAPGALILARKPMENSLPMHTPKLSPVGDID